MDFEEWRANIENDSEIPKGIEILNVVKNMNEKDGARVLDIWANAHDGDNFYGVSWKDSVDLICKNEGLV